MPASSAGLPYGDRAARAQEDYGAFRHSSGRLFQNGLKATKPAVARQDQVTIVSLYKSRSRGINS
jgi:hypothetical protein